MTIASGELFELCKQVYEATGWDDTDKVFSKVINRRAGSVTSVGRGYKATRKTDGYVVRVVRRDNRQKYTIPLYTSDYLLEKLPFFHEYWNGGNEAGYLTVKHWAVRSEAGYWEENGDRKPDNKFTSGYADTPLEALLKLTLKLYKEIV